MIINKITSTFGDHSSLLPLFTTSFVGGVVGGSIGGTAGVSTGTG